MNETTRTTRRLAAWVLAATLAVGAGCGDETAVGPAPVGGEGDDVIRDPAGPAEPPPARRVRRLTAEQFHRSLEVATGQSWSRYEQFAGALGRPDYAEVTDEGLELSVTFDKLVHDAARETCARAVIADLGAVADADRAILREATIASRDLDALRENLRYLHLRFLAADVLAEDPRLDPYLLLLTSPPVRSDADMAERWVAVCVALATHPDFLTY